MKTLTEKVADYTKNVAAGLALVAIAVPVVYAIKKMHERESMIRPMLTEKTAAGIGYSARPYQMYNYESEEQYLFI